LSPDQGNFQGSADSTGSGEGSNPSRFARCIEFGLQPLLITLALGIWIAYPGNPAMFLFVLAGVQLLLAGLESWIPARRDWQQPMRERMTNIAIVIVILVGTVVVAEIYQGVLAAPLADLRVAMHLDIWPTSWPLLLQIFLAFAIGEFILYWIHRAEHRWGWVWRLSGHGVHHSFKRLNAINFGVNHPFETFLLVIPLVLTELFFGAGKAAAGAAILGAVQTGIVHSNLRLNARWIGLFFTTNEAHIRHHSVVLDESNTNYGCSSILWDRVFGTFGSGPVVEAGIGPSEPTLMEKIMMPFREPADSVVAP